MVRQNWSIVLVRYFVASLCNTFCKQLVAAHGTLRYRVRCFRGIVIYGQPCRREARFSGVISWNFWTLTLHGKKCLYGCMLPLGVPLIFATMAGFSQYAHREIR